MQTPSLASLAQNLRAGSVGILGVPFDANSSFRRGAAAGPTSLRQALHSSSANLCAENGLDLASEASWVDLGDLELAHAEEALAAIETGAAKVLATDARLISLGGDHSIAYPLLRAHAQLYPKLNLLQIDAHPDLYEELDGNRFSHACPFARILEEGLVQRLVQVGIRTMNPHQQKQAERFGVEVIDMRSWRPDIQLHFDGPVYLSVDLDALDPAFAPGVSHHEPGGLSTRDLLGIVQGFEGKLVGADIVELNPERDWMGMTAMAAAKILKEVLARLLQ
ncbi:MAG: agmatinase [Deltaproteobacteria bacterium]|nr:agmatinase [Deltaproteobacteria bacterium]